MGLAVLVESGIGRPAEHGRLDVGHGRRHRGLRRRHRLGFGHGRGRLSRLLLEGGCGLRLLHLSHRFHFGLDLGYWFWLRLLRADHWFWHWFWFRFRRHDQGFWLGLRLGLDISGPDRFRNRLGRHRGEIWRRHGLGLREERHEVLDRHLIERDRRFRFRGRLLE